MTDKPKHTPSYQMHAITLDVKARKQTYTVRGYPKIVHAFYERSEMKWNEVIRQTLFVHMILDVSQPESTMTFRILQQSAEPEPLHPGTFLCMWRTKGAAFYLFHDETGPIHTERRDGTAHPPAYQNPGDERAEGNPPSAEMISEDKDSTTSVAEAAARIMSNPEAAMQELRERRIGVAPALGAKFEASSRRVSDNIDMYADALKNILPPGSKNLALIVHTGGSADKTTTREEAYGVTLNGTEVIISQRNERELMTADIVFYAQPGSLYDPDQIVDLAVMFDGALMNTVEWWTGRLRRATVVSVKKEPEIMGGEVSIVLRLLPDVIATVDPTDHIAQIMARRSRFPNEPHNFAWGMNVQRIDPKPLRRTMPPTTGETA